MTRGFQGDHSFHFLLKDRKSCDSLREQMSSVAENVVVEESRLSELDIEAIEMFISFFKLIGLPKSVGEIYGLLFVATCPLSMEDLMDRLQISLGAASQGLKLLRSVGAVKVVYAPGERRDHYVADLELSKFATSFIKEEMKPRLERALQRVERMESLAKDLDPKERRTAFERIDRLKHWMERGQKMMPWILKFLVS